MNRDAGAQDDESEPKLGEVIFDSAGRSESWTVDARANIKYLYIRHRAIMQRITVDPTFSERVLHKSNDECVVICRQVGKLLKNAVDAANAVNPTSGRTREWWTGVRAEATYKNLHYAEATIARLYKPDEVKSEVLDAVRRARSVLAVDDLARHASLIRVAKADPKPCTADELGEIIAVGHEAADRNRSKLRSFRNVLFVSWILAFVLLLAFVWLCNTIPSLLPLCFVHDPPPIPKDPKNGAWIVCPSGSDHVRPADRLDVFIVAVLGVIGGAMSAAVFVRGLYGQERPYDVSVQLALLKLPFGGFAAIIGVMFLAGDFVPGFTAVDTQNQILAYAVVFGFAQQLVTRWIDDRAEALINDIPSKAKASAGLRSDDLGVWNTSEEVASPYGKSGQNSGLRSARAGTRTRSVQVIRRRR